MSESAQMPRYVCHKIVHALKITAIKGFDSTTDRLYPEDTRFGPFEVEAKWVAEKKAIAPGYYVVYEDGYTSWSPVEAFEKGYTLETDAPVDPKVYIDNLERRIKTLVEDNNAVRYERDVLKAHTSSLTTTLRNVGKTMQACIALADSELIKSEPSTSGTSFSDETVRKALERHTYYVPPCGCKGFFHDNACSDQNPLDPFGAISNPDHQARVRAMARQADIKDVSGARRLSNQSPWRTTLQQLVELIERHYAVIPSGFQGPLREARELLKDGVALGQYQL